MTAFSIKSWSLASLKGCRESVYLMLLLLVLLLLLLLLLLLIFLLVLSLLPSLTFVS